MREVASVRQVEPHDAAVGLHDAGVHGEVGRSAGQRLHVDAPLFGAEAEHLERALLRQLLHLVNVFVTTVVPAECDLQLMDRPGRFEDGIFVRAK